MSRLRSILRAAIRQVESDTRIVYPWELPSIMRRHIVTGAMGTLYFHLLSGIFLVAFGNALGMAYWQWGLLSAAASFSLALQLVSAYVVRRVGFRKRIWFISAMAARLVRGVAIAAAFLLADFSGGAALTVFIGLLLVGNCLDALAAPPWLSWLADIIPREQHGYFMGRRSAWIAAANALVIVPIGYALDRSGAQPHALMVVFGLGLVVGVLDLVIHQSIPEPPMNRTARNSFWREVLVPLRDGEFRHWLVFNGLWTFSMTLGGSLATIHFVQNLGIQRNFAGGSLVLILVPMVTTALIGRYLGQWVDRHGVRSALRRGHALWATLPAFWLLARPQAALLWLGVAAFVAGVGSHWALVASNKLITRLRPPEEVPMYSAVSACTGALAGGFGPLVGGFLLEALRGQTWHLAGAEYGGFHVLFAASLVLRLLSTLAIRWVPEVESA